MTRNRFFVLGLLGAIMIIVILCAVIYFVLRGPYDMARAHWAEKGSGNYTLIVSDVNGEYRITVQSGTVTDFEPVSTEDNAYGSTQTATTPAHFQSMTVESMLTQAGSIQVDVWISMFSNLIRVTYDPTYGYVTGINYTPNRVIGFVSGGYINQDYRARDLVITEP